jgi:hypothetical protein
MAAPPSVVAPPPLGSTRLIHTFYDWSQLQATLALGPGNTPQWYNPKTNLNSTAAIPAWANLSGVNKINGRLASFLQAASFNIGLDSKAVVPIVGGSPGRSLTTPVPEAQQYYAYNFLVAMGNGLPQSGFTPINPAPRYTTIAQTDVGIFFFVWNENNSSSSYQQFSDNGGVNGAEAGFGFFIDDADGDWHYGIRYVNTGANTPLDIDVHLPPGPGAGQWPVPVSGGVPDYTQFVLLTLEWFSATASGAAQFVASLNGKPLVNTTLADIGSAPVGAGLVSQLPDFYSQSTTALSHPCFGALGKIRCGGGTGAPVQTFPLSFGNIEYVGGPALPSTFISKT